MAGGGGGTGSTIGGAVGGIGGSYFGPVGGMIGGAAGSLLGGLFDKDGNKPKVTQSPPFDPYAHLGNQTGVIEPYLRSSLEPGALDAYAQEASPLFSEGVQGMRDTIAGKYLDPMESAPFQRLSDARQSLAQMMFRDQMTNVNNSASMPFNSSARVGAIARRGEDISTKAAQDIASAGWNQYGAERGYQDAAMRGGSQLAPNIANMAAGAQAQDMQNVLNYIRSRAMTPPATQFGPTPEQEASSRMAGIAPFVKGINDAGGLRALGTIFDNWRMPKATTNAGMGVGGSQVVGP